MTATIRYDADSDLTLARSKRIAVMGYGSQGHAHALNLKESGCDVRVGLRDGSASRAHAEAQGLRVLTPAAAAAEADVIMILAPDTAHPALYDRHIAPNLQPGATRMFAHGFNILYCAITPPSTISSCCIAPKLARHGVP